MFQGGSELARLVHLHWSSISVRYWRICGGVEGVSPLRSGSGMTFAEPSRVASSEKPPSKQHPSLVSLASG